VRERPARFLKTWQVFCDYPTALAWYTRLFGSPPTFEATATEAGRVLAEHRTVYQPVEKVTVCISCMGRDVDKA
jgi:hypothetical protein